MPDFPRITSTGATAAEVWSYSFREVTRLTGSARSDVVGQDNSLESTTGSRIAKIDDVALETGGRLDSIPAFTTPTEASIVMDGDEKILVEITDVKSSEVEAWIDLSTMDVGDTIVIKYYRKLKSGGSYALYANETYEDVQSIPALCIMSKKVYRDTKVTAQQTAGVNRTLDIQLIRAIEA